MFSEYKKKRVIFIFLGILTYTFIFSCQTSKADLASDLSGKILLNVEKNGEAWYVNPPDKKRYFLGRPADAFQIMRELGLGISEVNFQRIAQAGMPVDGDTSLAKSLSGRIILQVEKNGEAWYINPADLKKYFLGRPKDAFEIMRKLSLGITRENLAKIHKPGVNESLNQFSLYSHKKISTKNGIFSIDIIEIDLANPKLKIITPVDDDYPNINKSKTSKHGAKSLADFVLDYDGFAGINGTYFCSSAGCGMNYFFYPVYDKSKKVMVNESELKYWTTGPIVVFDENNKFYYFKDSREFKNVAEFEKNFNTKIQAALGNKPRLIEKGMNTLIDWELDEKQKTAKSQRNAIAYKNNKIYLVVAGNTTVPDLAEIMKTLEMEYALNLDGGYSSALWYNDEYMIKPGRDVTNAIIFYEE